jgi:hypothetical protein
MKRAILFAGVAVLAGCGGQTSSNSFNSYDSSLGQPAALNATGPGAIPNAAAWPSENGKPMLVFGVDAPAIAKIVQTKDDLTKNSDVDQALTQVRNLGFNVVRLTLFSEGEGLKLNKDGTVNGLAEGVEKNLVALANLAKAKNLKLYVAMPNSFNGYLKYPLIDKNAQKNYLQNAVAVVARKLKGNSSVFAIRAAGELKARAEADKIPAVTWEQVRIFDKAASDAVKKQDPERLVSAGPYAASQLAEAQITAFGLDFFELKDSETLPQVKTLNLNRPVLLADIAGADSKMTALKSVEAGFAGFFYPTLGWKGVETETALLDKDGKPTKLAESLSGVIKEITPIVSQTNPQATKPVAP